MKVIRKVRFFSVLVVATLFLQNASATLLLPDSHYLGGAWQGTSYYNEGGFNVRIDFAVYDTTNYPDDFTWQSDLPMPETDQYIYAYQIFNRSGDYEEVIYFSILDITENPIDEFLMHSTSSQDDGKGGIAPELSSTQGVWEFGWIGDALVAGKHSYFLVFSSEYAPVTGSYGLTPRSDPNPVPEIPEPAVIALLGFGSVLMFVKQRKSV